MKRYRRHDRAKIRLGKKKPLDNSGFNPYFTPSQFAWFKPEYHKPEPTAPTAKPSRLALKVEQVLHKLACGYRLVCIKLDKGQKRFELSRPGERIAVKVKRPIVEALFKLKYVLPGLFGSIILSITGRKAALA